MNTPPVPALAPLAPGPALAAFSATKALTRRSQGAHKVRGDDDDDDDGDGDGDGDE